MASARTQDATAKGFAVASTVNSFLLPLAAALHFNVAFWILVATNFALFHAIWVSQLIRLKSWKRVDWGWHLFRWPLVAFALLGNLSLALWGSQLLGVFPS